MGVNGLSICEPLIGPIPDLRSRRGSWTDRTRQRRALVDYVDGEWTPRPERIEWVRAIQRRCNDQGVAFFFKQWGGPTSKAAGRRLDGTVHDEFPTGEPGMLAAGK